MLPTIAEVLRLPSVEAGDPVIVTGEQGLDRPVRWVHVAPPSGGQRLLLGGELLLATGADWPADPPAVRAYVEELSAADVTGLVRELGNRYASSPCSEGRHPTSRPSLGRRGGSGRLVLRRPPAVG